ncbi:MAG TPA: phosphodiester glycosidase family protein [Gammaproteobacteria bacterium]|nr:phosphodiester glycosidase family protein [Gammaproteobacteria bacterium]
MRLRQFINIFLMVWCVIASVSIWAEPTRWQTVQPGLEYTRISDFPGFPGGSIHAFRIDLKYYNFKLALTQKADQTSQIPELMQQQGAVIAVNGGFFSPEFKPLGLRISEGQELNPLKGTPWWGVFYIVGQQAHIVARNAYKPNTLSDFAIQAGPRLLVDGVIPGLSPNIDFRTALGITEQGQVILLATDNVLLSTAGLADIMRRSSANGGLACIAAINLDGGHSTQLYTRLKNLALQVPSYAPVADAILVMPRQGQE